MGSVRRASVVDHDESSSDALLYDHHHPARKIKKAFVYRVVLVAILIAHIQKPFHLIMGALLFRRLGCKKNHTAPRDGKLSDEGLKKKTPANKKDASDDADTQNEYNMGANVNKKGMHGNDEPGIGLSIQRSVSLLSKAVTDHGTSVENGLTFGLGGIALGVGSIALSQLAIAFVPLIGHGYAH